MWFKMEILVKRLLENQSNLEILINTIELQKTKKKKKISI